MRPFRFVVFAFALVCAVVAGLSAGGSGQAARAKSMHVDFFNSLTGIPYDDAATKGAQAAAKKLHASIEVFNANYQGQTQASQIQDALAKHSANVFVVQPVNGPQILPDVREAIKKHIIVTAASTPLGPNPKIVTPQVKGLTSTVTLSEGKNGRYLGREVIKACARTNPCNVVLIGLPFSQEIDKVQIYAAKNALSGHSNIHVVALEQANTIDVPGGLAAAQNALAAHPNVSVIAAGDDGVETGAEKAVEAANLTGKVKLIGDGATYYGVKSVRAGHWFASVVATPYDEGYYATLYGIKAAEGKKVPKWVESSTLSPIGPVADKQSLSTRRGKKFKGEY